MKRTPNKTPELTYLEDIQIGDVFRFDGPKQDEFMKTDSYEQGEFGVVNLQSGSFMYCTRGQAVVLLNATYTILP